MEANKEPRKYSRRKNSNAASHSLPNSDEAALNSSPSAGKGMDSINIELSGIANIIRRKLNGNNFCMREHVAAMREKDVRKCYPFPYDESEVDTAKLKQSLPPMVLPEKFQFRLSVDQSINNESTVTARLALVSISAAEGSDHQVPQIGDSHLEINVLEGITMSADESNIPSNSDQHTLLDGQKEKNSGASDAAIIGHHMSLDANASDLIPEFMSTCASPAVTSGVMQEDPENDCVPVHDEPASRNLELLAKVIESSESGESAAADSQGNIQLTKKTSESSVRSVTKVAEKDLKVQPTTRTTRAASETSNISSSSSSVRRRKPRKTRLMRDILADVNSLPRTDQLNRNQDAPNDTSHNASAEIVFPGPQVNVDSQKNEERFMPEDEVDISTQKASGKEIENDAKSTLRKMPAGKDSSFTGILTQFGLMHRSWSCSRPRMPRRRIKGVIRSVLEPIKEDERENEDFSDDATRVSLTDRLVKSATTTCKRKENSLFPLGAYPGGESNGPKRVGEPSRQMANFGMPGMNDKKGFISQVDDGINIYKHQKGQLTRKRSNQHFENPGNVPDTGILRLFGQQVSCKEMPKERNEEANKALKAADCLSPLGANHFHLNSDGQAHIPFGLAEVSRSKGKATMDIPSLRGSSSGILEGIFEHGSSHTGLQVSKGCDTHKHILDPDSEASLIWTSPTPMELINSYSIPKKVQASQPIKMHGKNMMGDDNLPDLNVPCLEAMQSDFIKEDSIRNREEFSFPWKKLEGSVNIYSNNTIPATNLLRLMDASKLSSALPPNGSSYPLGTKLCHNGSEKHNLSNINILQNSSNRENMKRSIHSAEEMATKSKGSTSKAGDEFPQGSSIIPFRSSSQHSFEKQKVQSIEENKPSKKQKVQSADACGTSFALGEIPQPMTCVLNRNPADFSAPDPGNPYMINGKDLKIGRVRANQRGSGKGSNQKAAGRKGRAAK